MTSCFAAKSKSTPYNVKVTSAGLQPMLQEMRREVNEWAAKLLLHDGLEHSQYQGAGWGDTVQYNTMYAFRRVVPPCRERQRLSYGLAGKLGNVLGSSAVPGENNGAASRAYICYGDGLRAAHPTCASCN
jgi:hypothetical protein